MDQIADTYKSDLNIPKEHSLKLTDSKEKRKSGRDDEWFTLTEYDTQGTVIATYDIESLQQTYPPLKSSHKITKTHLDGTTEVLKNETR